MGLLAGALLFAVFWSGTLSVFDREIDRWMAPVTRLSPAPALSLDRLMPHYRQAAMSGGRAWFAVLPSEREPFARVGWIDDSGNRVALLLDPGTGEPLRDAGTRGATGFIYPFHYSLLIPGQVGMWIVGAAGMAMLVLSVSGVIVHRRLFAEFFVLRLGGKSRRGLLDLHNAAGVLALPFHVVISFSGLVILWTMYFPQVWQTAYRGDARSMENEIFGVAHRERAGQMATVASFDAASERLSDEWRQAVHRYIFVRRPGDAAAVLQFGIIGQGTVSNSWIAGNVDASSGVPLPGTGLRDPAMRTLRFLAGVHIVQFRHWTLRWVYFALGLVGCVTIATGSLFWLESRRRKHRQLGLGGVRIVEGLTIGSVTGIVIATLSFFVVNKVLPPGATFLGEDRAALEIWTVYLVWLATFGHAWLRPGRAWIEQCWAVAAVTVVAVLLNWITTGDHLVRSLAHRHLWAVGGMDILLLVGAALAGLTAFKLRRRQMATGK
jgi:uncharacterized iron-regulated membrane protein